MAKRNQRTTSAVAAQAPSAPFGALHRAVHAIQQTVNESDLEISHPEAVVLALLAQTEEATMSEIHRGFGFRKSTVTSVIDRLVERKLALRCTDPTDARKWVVRLTPAGATKSRKVLKLFGDIETRITGLLAGRDP